MQRRNRLFGTDDAIFVTLLLISTQRLCSKCWHYDITKLEMQIGLISPGISLFDSALRCCRQQFLARDIVLLKNLISFRTSYMHLFLNVLCTEWELQALKHKVRGFRF